MNNVEIISRTPTHTIYNNMVSVGNGNYKLVAKAQPNQTKDIIEWIR